MSTLEIIFSILNILIQIIAIVISAVKKSSDD